MSKQLLIKNKFTYGALFVLVLVAVLFLIRLYGFGNAPVKIGVLHSLTGTMSGSEKPLVDALQLAISAANATGGFQEHPLVAIVADCRSDADFCAQQAERLIAEEKVSVLFGCWTSACRKAVLPVVEKHGHLLFYPVQYEGVEQSPNIIYTGLVPNQQIIPGVRWALEKLGKRVYLAGSDYVFPRMAGIIIKDVLKVNNGELVGERYMALGDSNMQALVADIAKKHPQFILNTMNGDSNSAFFKALHKAGGAISKIPVMSFSLGEVELSTLQLPVEASNYAVWNYFQSIRTPENQAFVDNFHAHFGADAMIDDPMESSYAGLKIWLQAAREAGSAEPDAVQRTVLKQTLHAPGGIVSVDHNTRHLWKKSRIGKYGADGQFDIVWESGNLIAPVPYPGYRFRNDWERLLASAEKGVQ